MITYICDTDLEIVVGNGYSHRDRSSKLVVTKGFTKGIQLQSGQVQALSNAVASTGGSAYASSKIVLGGLLEY